MKPLRLTHPGIILRTEFIEAHGLSVYRVAKETGIPQPSLAQITAGRRSISPENALRLGLYFGIDAEFWTNLQAHYDLRQTRRKRAAAIARAVIPLAPAA
jgi:addiction module HigA family antidote